MQTNPTATAAGRLPIIDNARAILIVLVVLGHVLPAGEPKWASALVLFLYSFHMYAFTVVSGYVSKPNGWTKRGLINIAKLLATYLIFAALHVVAYSVAVKGVTSASGLATAYAGMVRVPSFSLWWLLSLACWRLGLPLIERSRTRLGPWPVLAATLVLVAAGLLLGTNGKEFSWMRTLYYFPFFCFGYFARTYNWSLKRIPRRAWIAAVLMVGALAAAFVWRDNLSIVWFMARFTVADVTGIPNQAAGWRILAFVISAILTLSFFQLVPRRRTRFTMLGAHTLPIYLWHGTVLLWAKSSPLVPDWIWTNPLTVVALTALFVGMFGYGPIMRGTERFLSFNWITGLKEKLRKRSST